MASMATSVLDLLQGVQTELAIFFIAIFVHSLVFGSRRFKPAQKPKRDLRPKEGGDGSPTSGRPAPVPGSAALVRVAKKHLQLSVSQEALAQKFQDTAQTLPANEVCAALAAMLDNIGKSSSMELLGAVRDAIRGLEMPINTSVAESLLRGYLTLHMQQEFQEVLGEAEALGLASPAIMVLALRTSVEASDFVAAMGCLRRLGGLVKASAGSTVHSPMPHHLVQQLVQLALPKEALPSLLEELAANGFLTPSAVETAFVECGSKLAQGRRGELIRELEELANAHDIELTEKASAVLLCEAGSAQDALRIFNAAAKRGAVGKDLTLAALDASVTRSSKALTESVLQNLPKVLVPEVGAAVVRVIVDGPLHEKDLQPASDATVLRIYQMHLTGVDILSDPRAGRLVAEIALRRNRPDVLEKLLDMAEHTRRVALLKSFGSEQRLADATAIFRACRDKSECLYNALMDACIQCQDMKAAKSIFEEAVAAGMADVVTYNTIIKTHLQAGNLPAARAVIEKMRSAGGGCAPNVVTFNELIDATIRHSSEGVWVLIEEMKACNLQPTAVTGSIVLKCLQHSAKAADVERTMAFIESIDGGMDEVVLSSICEACIRANRPDILAQQLRRYRGIQVTNTRTSGSIIRAYGFLKDLQGAWEAWRAMRSRGIPPSDITIGCMVEALVANGDPEGGYELIRELSADERTRPLLNGIAYCSVLKGFSHKKCFSRVWEVYNEMVKAKLQFTIVTYNAVIDACVRSCEMARVQSLLEEMARKKIEPNVVTYSTIIKGYCQDARLNQAFKLFESMKQSQNLRPDEITYNTLIDGCAQRGLFDQGMKLLEEMQLAGVQPSPFTLTVLVKLANRGKRPDRAFEIVEELTKKYHLQLNFHVYANLVHTCTAHGDLNRAVQVLERMGRQRVRPDVRTYTLLIRAFIEAGKLPEVAGFISLACGIRGELPPGLMGLAGSSHDLQLRGELPQDLLREAMEAMAGRGAERLAVQLCKDLRGVPGLKLDPKLSMSLTSRAIRSPKAA
uniref:Pentacotripeptide-repeat region of PRORP domain-containing protein n=1 Tax=Alexandrium monilatum TaxID=311494 RepID=A0A7S4VAR9_9DINO